MPIYEYYCAKCDEEFDRMRPVSQMDTQASGLPPRTLKLGWPPLGPR